jgi:hypothetical protein
MHASSSPAFDFRILGLSEDKCGELQREVGVQRGKHRLIIGLWLVSTPVATLAWLAGLARAAIWLVELALS